MTGSLRLSRHRRFSHLSSPMLARTALSAAVTAALVSAPVLIGAPAFGSVPVSEIGVPGTTAALPVPTVTPTDEPTPSPEPSGPPDDNQSDEPQNDPEGDESPSPQEDESVLPEGSFDVRKASDRDTFALYDGSGGLFDEEDEDFDHSDIHIPLPDRQGAERDFVLTENRAALELVTADHPEGERFRPNVNGEGERTFTFDVADDGTIGEVSETTPSEPEESESPEPGPPPTPDPTPDPTPEPTPEPTDDPEPTDEPSSPPSPTDDPDDGDDREDEGDGIGDGSDDEGSDDDRGDDIPEDPSTGNGSDDGPSDDSREAVPSGDDDWVPRGPQRPDYSDPVPQPPGADEDDSITPDDEESAEPQAGGGDQDSDDLATDSAADGDGSDGMPWQIGAVVAIGAAAIGFILFVAGRRRKD